MRIIAYLPMLLLIANISCKQITHTDTFVKGVVINQTDNTPLVGYKVYLQETETTGAFQPNESVTIDERTTDSNGEFDFGEWEAKKNSKYRYFVVFDDNNMGFATQDWQEGGYKKVETEKEIDKGESNSITLNQVPFGFRKFIITNNSEFEVLKFEIILSNAFVSKKSFSREIGKLQTESNNDFYAWSAGSSIIEYQISDLSGPFRDTIYNFLELKHNEEKEIYFTYPPQ